MDKFHFLPLYFTIIVTLHPSLLIGMVYAYAVSQFEMYSLCPSLLTKSGKNEHVSLGNQGPHEALYEVQLPLSAVNYYVELVHMRLCLDFIWIPPLVDNETGPLD